MEYSRASVFAPQSRCRRGVRWTTPEGDASEPDVPGLTAAAAVVAIPVAAPGMAGRAGKGRPKATLGDRDRSPTAWSGSYPRNRLRNRASLAAPGVPSALRASRSGESPRR